jgi:hypothetical protein
MSGRRSTGVIFWGLTLVLIGVLLLAHNLGYRLQIWPYVVRYWPALLIAWGLLKFVDYFRFRYAGDNRPLFSGGEVALLIMVIFVGSAITTAVNVSPDLGNIFQVGDIDLWDITGNSYTFDEHQVSTVPAGSEIEIANSFGNVEIKPSESDQVVLDVKKTVRASSREEAERLEKDFTFSIMKNGSTYRIASNKDIGGFSEHSIPRQRFKSSLVIGLPKRSTLHVDNRYGRVSIQEVTGNQEISNRYGDVDVRDISGTVRLDNRNGNVAVEGVSESVVISNRYANTTAKNVGGNLEIDTRNGSVDASDIKGNATITNSYAPINVENVQGQLTINGRNNGVDVQHIQGDITANSSYQNVNMRDARAAVAISSRNGDLTLSFDTPPQKDIVITARYGSVTLELPSSSSFVVDARTEYGQIDSDFDGLNHDSTRRSKAVTGQVGRGGPKITIDLRNGDIHLGRKT